MIRRRIPITWEQAEIYPQPPPGRRLPDSNMGRLRSMILALPVDADVCTLQQCFCQHIYMAAKQVGARVRLRKMETGGFRVFRVSL